MHATFRITIYLLFTLGRLKNLTRVEKKALKKLRKDKRKSKTNKSLLDISSCTDDPSFHGDQTSSSHRSIESPLANVGTTVKEAVKKGKKTKGSASGMHPPYRDNPAKVLGITNYAIFTYT